MKRILDVLTQAVLAGAREVLRVRLSGSVAAEYKEARQLVTTADQRSDAAMRAVFERSLPALQDGGAPIALRLEESGSNGVDSELWIGADPLDGTDHFAAGGCSYCVQAHYVAHGIPQVGVVLQPEVYLPVSESETCMGRLTWAMRGAGAFTCRTELAGESFVLGSRRPLLRRTMPATKAWVACVPLSTKMNDDERQLARRVLDSGIVSVTTGVGGAGGNVMLAIFGGQHVYANFGAGEDLDLIPPQVIAEEAGLTVWGLNRRPPVWKTRKQPFVVAQSADMAEEFFRAAGL